MPTKIQSSPDTSTKTQSKPVVQCGGGGMEPEAALRGDKTWGLSPLAWILALMPYWLISIYEAQPLCSLGREGRGGGGVPYAVSIMKTVSSDAKQIRVLCS